MSQKNKSEMVLEIDKVWEYDNKKKAKVKKAFDKKKKKKIKKVLIIIVLAVAILVISANKLGLFEALSRSNKEGTQAFATYTVSRGTITKTLTSSGTIEPKGKSSVTALVTGKIVGEHFKEGDIVEKDQLLYEIETTSDLSDLKDRLEDAQEELGDAREEMQKLYVESEYEGTVQKLYVEVGDEVKAGEKIADVIDMDIMCIDSPFMTVDAKNIRVGDTCVVTITSSYEEIEGVVYEISPLEMTNSLGVKTRDVKIRVSNVGGISTQTSAYARIGDAVCTEQATFYYNDEGTVYAEISGEVSEICFDEGYRIKKNQAVVILESEELVDRIKELSRSVERAQENLDDYLERYNITSPIAGTVMSKEYVVGETIGSGNQNSTTLAEIYDMSAFEFKMTIDDLDIDSLAKGQEVIVTSSARSGYKWYGTVTNISVQGTTQNGATSYPVTVTIYNEEDTDKRKIDEDGTIHKFYKSGKISTVKTYVLEEKADNVYKYGDGIEISVVENESGKTYMLGAETLRLLSDGTYSLNKNFYTLSDDMKTLVVEETDESNMLRPGMNVDAEIILGEAKNVITVPVEAVSRGNTVKLLKKSQDVTTEVKTSKEQDKTRNERPQMPEGETSKAPDGETLNFENKTMGNERPFGNNTYGTAPADSEYELVEITIGISDEEKVEVTSGLSEGDVIIVDQNNVYAREENTYMPMMGGGVMGSGMMGSGGRPVRMGR